jgi:transposase
MDMGHTRWPAPGQPAVLFEYDPSRSEAVPTRLLGGFQGVLQADGYSGYNWVCRENSITRIGCWDRVRRKFVKANHEMTAHNKGAKVRKLYTIENRITELDRDQKREQRQTMSLPVLDVLKYTRNT